MPANKETYVKAQVVFLAKSETHRPAIRIEHGDDKTASWVPRSTLSWACDQKIDALKAHDEFEIELTDWKALDIGLEY